MANEFKVRKGLIVQGSGSTILDIQGSQGQLFSVTDSLSGSLFSVNDISGVPIMEVFSDNRVNLGTFNAEAIKVSGSFATMTGSLFGTASWADNATTATSATQTSQAVTFNNGGAGAASGTTFNGSTARTISYNTIGAVPTGRTLTINGTAYDLSANRSWNVGTVTSIAGTGGYGGLTLSGTVTSTGNITLGGTPTGTWPISVSGNASSADEAGKIYQNDTGGSGEFLIPMADQTVGNYARLYNTSNQADVLRYKVSTSTLFSKFFDGALSGNATTATTATNVTATANNSTNETTYITFVDGATGIQGIETDTALTYNPATNTLTALIVNSSTAVRGGNGSAAAPAFSFSGDTNTGMFRPIADTLGFATAGSEKMRIDSSGNVGIGTTSPSYKLDVNSNTSRFGEGTNGHVIISDDGYGGDLGIITDNDESIAIKYNDGTFRYGGPNPGAETLIISGSSVGIGTSSPSAKLEVNGTININSIGDRVFIADPSVGTFSIGDLDGLGDEAQIVGDATTIKINNAGNTTLTSTFSNTIGIGTTTTQGKLHVYQTANLGGTGGDSLILQTLQNTGGTGGNAVFIKDYAYRDAIGTDWTTWRHHNSIDIDGVYNTPGTNTRTWWERDPLSQIQYFGSSASTTLTINSAINTIIANNIEVESNTTGIYSDGGDLAVGDFNGNGYGTTFYGVGGSNLIYLASNSTRFYYPIVYNPPGISEVNGEVAYWGGGSVVSGSLYYYDSSGNWTAADADTASTATGMLGIARATGTASSVGMLLRGRARFTANSNYTALTTVGAPLYISTTAGEFSQTAPSGTGDIVRIIGYVQSTANDEIYFCPDNTWVEIT